MQLGLNVYTVTKRYTPAIVTDCVLCSITDLYRGLWFNIHKPGHTLETLMTSAAADVISVPGVWTATWLYAWNMTDFN